eukprot:scaffold184420_cov15-Tisochrysis_lutea.AAC.1
MDCADAHMGHSNPNPVLFMGEWLESPHNTNHWVGFTPGLIMHVSPNLLFSNLLSCRRTPMQGARKKIGSFRPQ